MFLTIGNVFCFGGECTLNIYQCLAHSKTHLSTFPKQPLSSVHPHIYYRTNQQNYVTSYTPNIQVLKKIWQTGYTGGKSKATKGLIKRKA